MGKKVFIYTSEGGDNSPCTSCSPYPSTISCYFPPNQANREYNPLPRPRPSISIPETNNPIPWLRPSNPQCSLAPTLTHSPVCHHIQQPQNSKPKHFAVALVDAGVEIDDDVDGGDEDFGRDEDDDCVGRQISSYTAASPPPKVGKQHVKTHNSPIHSRYSPCFVPT